MNERRKEGRKKNQANQNQIQRYTKKYKYKGHISRLLRKEARRTKKLII